MGLYKFFMLFTWTVLGLAGFNGIYMLIKIVRKLALNKAIEEVEFERTLKKFSSITKWCISLGITFYIIALLSLLFH